MLPKESDQSNQMRLVFQPERKVYAIAELNRAIQDVFAADFSRIWVTGEVSGCRIPASGHYYFCLKDKDSQIKCVLFKNSARLNRLKPQDGLAVALYGNLEVYQSRGEYQIIVERLELNGVGSLQAAFELLKSRLAGEGLFAADRKKPLPRFPWRIGIVTSVNGAVIQDMLHVLARRFPGLHIRLHPAVVQGEEAAQQICSALRHFNREPWADLLIVARGGGSLEDLWTFNEESVARAIAASTIPVISAVGHETDFTIADFVADYRAPTPSAAAEIAICTRDSLLSTLTDHQSRLTRALRFRLLQFSREVQTRAAARSEATVRRLIRRRTQQIDEAEHRLKALQVEILDLRRRRLELLLQRLQDANLPLRLARNRHRQEVLVAQLSQRWRSLLALRVQGVETRMSRLAALSPISVLGRGYAIVEKDSGQVLRRADETTEGERIHIRLENGGLRAVVSSLDSLRTIP